MMTIDPAAVCVLPLSRQEVGFAQEGDRGNAVLLLADEMQEETRAVYQQMGCLFEGACITWCSEELYTILEQLDLYYCPWPDRGFTLTVIEHARLSVLADRFVVSRLLATSEAVEPSDEKEE
jgi:hypothetical protein